jgi:hypothetical protein
LTDAAKNVLSKGKTVKDLPIDNCIEILEIDYDLSAVENPSQLTLTVRIAGTKYVNSWHVWVYPETAPSPDNKPYFTTDFNDATAKVQAGDNVLYCLTADKVNPEKIGNIAFGFTPVFCNTALFPFQKPNTLGIYCNPEHPALAAFPNDGYSDFQWWDIIKGFILRYLQRTVVCAGIVGNACLRMDKEKGRPSRLFRSETHRQRRSKTRNNDQKGNAAWRYRVGQFDVQFLRFVWSVLHEIRRLRRTVFDSGGFSCS